MLQIFYKLFEVIADRNNTVSCHNAEFEEFFNFFFLLKVKKILEI